MRRQGRDTPTVSGLRTRYVPKSRISPGFLSIAPWLDIVLIVLFVVLLETKFILQPGVVIDLPTLPLAGGAPRGLTVMVLAVDGVAPGRIEEIVLFDDSRYRTDSPDQMSRLKEALRSEAEARGVARLLLEADQRVRHGTLVALYRIARDIGLDEVAVAARADARPGKE